MSILKKHGRLGQWLKGSKQMSVIDLDLLLAEITDEDPSGAEDLEYDPVFLELEKKIEGTPEIEIKGKVHHKAKDPNWAEVQEAALELSTRTHDLRVAVYLTQALLHTKGLIGFCDGLKLLRGLIEKYWESLYPQLEPDDNNDPTRRINILSALYEWDDIIRPLMKATLCASPTMGRFSLRDIRIATGEKIDELVISDMEEQSAPNILTIEEAFKNCDVKDLEATKMVVSESLHNLEKLDALLFKNIGSERPPDFRKLEEVLKEMDAYLFRQVAGRASPKA